MKRLSKIMWSLVLLYAVVLLLTWEAWAEPFLVCDPQTDATGYIYTMNGGPEVTVPYETRVLRGTTYAFIADLGPLPNGAFTYSVKAYNVWGQSIAVPFSDTKVLPGSVSRMVISR
jgi:hypothetical protein